MCLYVRKIGIAEGRRLQRMVRTGGDRTKVRRAQSVLASAQGSKVPDIARRLYFSPRHVRTVIRAFNTEGCEGLAPKYCGGRPRKFTEEQRSLILGTALRPPDLLGQPFPRWSLAKLRDHNLHQRSVDSISIQTIRQMNKAAKVKLRHTKTWEEYNDPKLASKKLILRYVNQPAANGPTIAFDEFGPLEIRP